MQDIDQEQKQKLLRYLERQIKRREKYIATRTQQIEDLEVTYEHIANEEPVPSPLSFFMKETIHRYDAQNRKAKRRQKC